MPTVDAANHSSLTGGEVGQHGKGLVVEGGWAQYTRTRPRIRLLDAKGELVPEVQVILRMVAEANIILNCGHISYEEMERLVPAAQAAGARKVVVDHPYFTRLTIEQQEKLVSAGALMNYTAGEILPRWWRVSVEDFAAGIRRLGVENVLISSDCGQLHNPPSIEALRLTIQLLLEEGFSADEIRAMFHHRAAQLLYE